MHWNTPLSGGGKSTILAYEKDVPRQGGWVLRKDGKVQQLTAPEFQAVPRPKS